MGGPGIVRVVSSAKCMLAFGARARELTMDIVCMNACKYGRVAGTYYYVVLHT